MAGATLSFDGATLAVAGRLDHDSVVALAEAGATWLAQRAPAECRVDLAGVDYSTSAGIALLLGWLRAATQAGKQLRFDNLPADMAAIARVGGLDHILQG